MSETETFQLQSHRNGHDATFHGSWYRGEHTNFIPSKAELTDEAAIDDFILPGWLPPRPFIAPATPIAAFGSCFAQHITQFLIERGYNVLGNDLSLYAHIIRFGEGMVNTFAIRQQLEWALGDKEFPENLWFGPNKEIAAVDPVIRQQTYEIINAASVFIVTLGLSEIWYNKVTGDAFWRAIPASLFDETKHGFRLSSVDENYENLVAIQTCIKRLRPDASVVFTLSPIPLMATFRPISCLTANSVSKAILRVAIDRFMSTNGDDQTYYFPSYEIANEMFINPRQADNRHLKPEVVTSIMEAFNRHYCTGHGSVA